MVETVSDAVADVGVQVRAAMGTHPGFRDIGKRMLLAWSEGVQGLRDKRVYALPQRALGESFEGFSAPAKLEATAEKVGRSPLLGQR